MTSTTTPTEHQTSQVTQARPRAQRHHALLLFHVGGEEYGIPLRHLQEVVLMARLSRSPGLPGILAGFLNLGGSAIPVLRLDRLLGLSEQTPGLYTPLIVLATPIAAWP